MLDSTADACKLSARKSAIILPQTSQFNDDMEIRGGGKDAALLTWHFNYIDEQWQRRACAKLGVHRVNRFRRSSPDVPLTRPDPQRMRRILGDGNCSAHSRTSLLVVKLSTWQSIVQFCGTWSTLLICC